MLHIKELRVRAAVRGHDTKHIWVTQLSTSPKLIIQVAVCRFCHISRRLIINLLKNQNARMFFVTKTHVFQSLHYRKIRVVEIIGTQLPWYTCSLQVCNVLITTARSPADSQHQKNYCSVTILPQSVKICSKYIITMFLSDLWGVFQTHYSNNQSVLLHLNTVYLYI